MDRSTTASFEIRTAEPVDVRTIEDVLHVGFEEFKACCTTLEFSTMLPSQADIRRRLEEGPIWIASMSNQIVGTVSAVMEDGGLYVRSMAVIPRARRVGVGVALIKCAEAYARDNGCGRIFLTTRTFMQAAIRFYERAGFRRTDDPPHKGFEGPDFFTMVKQM